MSSLSTFIRFNYFFWKYYTQKKKKFEDDSKVYANFLSQSSLYVCFERAYIHFTQKIKDCHRVKNKIFQRRLKGGEVDFIWIELLYWHNCLLLLTWGVLLHFCTCFSNKWLLWRVCQTQRLTFIPFSKINIKLFRKIFVRLLYKFVCSIQKKTWHFFFFWISFYIIIVNYRFLFEILHSGVRTFVKYVLLCLLLLFTMGNLTKICIFSYLMYMCTYMYNTYTHALEPEKGLFFHFSRKIG